MSEFYSIMSMPFYIHSKECYIKVLTLDRMPAPGSSLNQIVKRVTIPKLSQFQQATACNPIERCGNVFIKPGCSCNDYATEEDLPIIFTFLSQNNYTINTNVTQMLNQGNVQSRYSLICYINQ
tara:strand:+ start:979 stop:1347 length:369 start_codon:yes stop_codon:yes gene_type:complete